MLTLYHNGSSYPLQVDDYYIRQLVSGLDEVIFEISVHDPAYMMLQEEEQITDRGGQVYLVKQIDAGATSAKVICQLDLDAWKQTLHVGYNSGSKSCLDIVEAVAPSGWTVIDQALYSQRRTIKGDYTPLEICQTCCSVFKVYIRWDNKLRTVRIIPQTIGEPVGSFATRELNLTEINYKGKSIDFATRIYPYGKDGLTIQGATIDGATYPYAYIDDHSYSDKIISVYWKDERYTVVQNLFDDAKARLAQMAKPVRSYDCAIVDLKATNPDKYGPLNFGLFTVALLVDDTKGTSVNYQVIERREYPYYPERNEVIFDSAPQKITTSVTSIADAVENPNSEFQQIMDAEIALATEWLTNADSYVYMVKNANETIKEILFLDGTQDLSQATHVMRLNSAGLGFSKTGVNGRYTSAFVFDDVHGGHLIADVITAGSMSANRVRTGKLVSVISGAMTIDLDNGTITLGDKALRITAGNFKLDEDGNVTITGKLSNGKPSLNSSRDGVYVGTDGISVGTFKGGSASATGFKVTSGGVATLGGIRFFLANGKEAHYGLWAKNGGSHIGSGGPCDFNSEADGVNYLRGGTWVYNGMRVSGGMELLGDLNFSTEHDYYINGVNEIHASGKIVCEQVIQTSDERAKEDITALSGAEEFVAGLRPVRYRFKGEHEYHHGFVAQEVREIADTGIVAEDADGMLGISYTDIIADLVSVVQKQREQINNLEARLSRVEALLEGDLK